MKAATYQQGGAFAVAEVTPPRIGPGELLVRVRASSICGTDLRIIRYGHRKLTPGQRIILGHEFAGVIEEVGAGVRGYAPGQRVGLAPNIGCGRCDMCARGLPNMCPDYVAFGICLDGAHAELVRVPVEAVQQGNIIPLPDGVSWAAAALAEPLSCVVNGLRNVRVGLGDVVVIFGAGPIGLLHQMLAYNLGAARVIMVDTNARRLARVAAGDPTVLTLQPGTDDVRERVMAETGGRGADVIVTACSVAAVQAQALALLAPFGRVSFFGGLPADGADVALNTNLIHYRNLTVTGSTGGSTADYRTALRLIERGRADVGRVISHTVPVARMAEAFEAALGAEAMKVVIAYGD